MVGAVFSAVAGVALVAIITNGMSKSAAGTVFATTSLFLIVSAIVQLGSEVGLVRFLPAQIATGSIADVRPTLRTAFFPVAAVASVVAVVVMFTAPSFAHLVAGEEYADTIAAQLRVLAFFLPVAAVANAALAGTRGFRTMRPTVLIEALGRSLLQLLGVLCVQIVGGSAVWLVLAWSAPYLLALLGGCGWLVLLVRRLPGSGVPSRGVGRAPVSTGLVASFWRFTAPRAVANVLQTLLKRSDIVLVAAMRSPAEAALYAAATRFVVFGQLGVQAMQQALAPQLSSLFARGENDAAGEIYKIATAWSMLFAWPIYLTCAVLAPSLLGFFGAGYADATEVVVVLSLAMLFATASGAVDTVLLMSGRSWLSLANVGTALTINIGLNLLLIPRLGLLGAALSWAVAILIRNLLPLLEIKLLLGMTPLGKGASWVAMTATACFGLAPAVPRILGSPVPIIISFLGAGALCFAWLIWIGRARLRLDSFRDIFARDKTRAGKQRPAA